MPSPAELHKFLFGFETTYIPACLEKYSTLYVSYPKSFSFDDDEDKKQQRDNVVKDEDEDEEPIGTTVLPPPSSIRSSMIENTFDRATSNAIKAPEKEEEQVQF